MRSNTPDSEKYIPDLYFTVNQMKATNETIWVRNWCRNRIDLLNTIKDYKHRKEATEKTAKFFTHVMIIKAHKQFNELIRNKKIPYSFIDWSQIKATDVYPQSDSSDNARSPSKKSKSVKTAKNKKTRKTP